MMGGGNPGGGPPDSSPLLRFVVSSMAAIVLSGLMIVIYAFAPHHEPRLRPDGPGRTPVRDGVWEKKDFFGLVDTQWTIRNGAAEGDALQFYANGSLFREMTYRDGRLDGPVREYHEKERYRRSPILGRVASPAERAMMAGALKRQAVYRNGVAEGPYETYHPNGMLREEGVYRSGRKHRLATYRKDGSVSLESKNGSEEEGSAWIRGR